jgi:hypothetical protein
MRYVSTTQSHLQAAHLFKESTLHIINSTLVVLILVLQDFYSSYLLVVCILCSFVFLVPGTTEWIYILVRPCRS